MSPARLVLLTPRARADLDAIWAYSEEKWGRRRAEAYVRLIAKAFDDLAAGASVARSAEDVRAGYFRLTVGSHVIFFRLPDDGSLTVVRILHQRMDVSRHL